MEFPKCITYLESVLSVSLIFGILRVPAVPTAHSLQMIFPRCPLANHSIKFLKPFRIRRDKDFFPKYLFAMGSIELFPKFFYGLDEFSLKVKTIFDIEYYLL